MGPSGLARYWGIPSASRGVLRGTRLGIGTAGSAHTQNVSPLTILAEPERQSVVRPARTAASASIDPVHRFSLAAISTLVVGVAVAIVTTSDPLWWHLHFSRLGMLDDFSARMFNSTTIAAGILMATYGVLVAAALPQEARRSARRAFRAAVISTGLHLSIVGVIPISVSAELHDVVAAGLGLSLLAIVATSLRLPSLARASGASRSPASCCSRSGWSPSPPDSSPWRSSRSSGSRR